MVSWEEGSVVEDNIIDALLESQSPQFKTAVSRHKSQQSKASQAHGKQHGNLHLTRSTYHIDDIIDL